MQVRRTPLLFNIKAWINEAINEELGISTKLSETNFCEPCGIDILIYQKV